MAMIVHFGQVQRTKPGAVNRSNYEGLRGELALLKVGDVFSATFVGKYSATCACNALTIHCRDKLGFEITVRQTKNVIEIERTK
jgi:hypothetical protein